MRGVIRQNITFSLRTLFQQSGFHDHRGSDARIGNRSDDRHLQCGLRGVRADALSQAGPARDDLVQDSRRAKFRCAQVAEHGAMHFASW